MQILEFRSCGSKNYSIRHRPPTGDDGVQPPDQTCVKCKGLSFASSHNRDVVTPSLMNEFITALLNDDELQVYVPQWTMDVEPKTREILTKLAGKVYSNRNMNKRATLKHFSPAITDTLPFGYRESLLEHFLLQVRLRTGKECVCLK